MLASAVTIHYLNTFGFVLSAQFKKSNSYFNTHIRFSVNCAHYIKTIFSNRPESVKDNFLDI